MEDNWKIAGGGRREAQYESKRNHRMVDATVLDINMKICRQGTIERSVSD